MTVLRDGVAGAQRVVVKIGSSSITGTDGRIDIGQMNALVDAIATAREAGREVVVVSSGAVAAGMEPLGLSRRPRDLASQQAAASVGQGLLLARYTALFEAHDLRVGQVLLTVEDVARQASYANAQRTFTRLLSLGIVPIVNENDTVATHELGSATTIGWRRWSPISWAPICSCCSPMWMGCTPIIRPATARCGSSLWTRLTTWRSTLRVGVRPWARAA